MADPLYPKSGSREEELAADLAREREARERAEREARAAIREEELSAGREREALARAEEAEAEVERLKSQIHAISQEP